MKRQMGWRRTVALDSNFKLLRLIKDIVKILGVQLGSEERVSVHCSRLAKLLRVSEVRRVNLLPGVKGSSFAKFFSARV